MVVLTYVFGSSDPWFVIYSLVSDLCLVLCCDIHRSTLISIMYPACMITVHDRKSRALQSSRDPIPRTVRPSAGGAAPQRVAHVQGGAPGGGLLAPAARPGCGVTTRVVE